MSGLRDSGGVLLVSTYELGHQPIGIASPLGFLERAGFRPDALDLAIDRLDSDENLARVRAARFIGFSVPMHTAMRIAIRAAERVRAENPSAHLSFYGLYAPLQRELLCAAHKSGRPLADSIIGGEFEQALVEECERLDAGEDTGKDTLSCNAASDDVKRNPAELAAVRAPRTILARLPFAPPSRDALPPLHRYAHLVRADGTHAVAGYTEASRGCLHLCRHCPIPALYEGRFFVVPVEIVLEDVRRQVAAGAEHVTLGDPDFLNGPRHAMNVVRAIHQEFPRLTFDATIKVEHILRRRELFPELADLGCLFVTTAAESLSENVLTILDKGHSRADIDEALGILRAAGISPRPTWVPFTPWTTLDDYLELIDFLDEQRLHACVEPVQLTIRLLVPPGSLLLAHPVNKVQHSVFKELDKASLSFTWQHSDHRMDQLQREAAALVHRADADREPPEVTHTKLRALAYATAGRVVPGAAPAIHFPTEGAPRLTESWFC